MAFIVGILAAAALAPPQSSAVTVPAAQVSEQAASTGQTTIASPTIAPTPAPCCLLAANTPVIVELLEPVSTKTHKRGDHFGIDLAEPVVIDGRTVIPAGARGQGEVVDAAGAGMAGHPGKLILAARYVEFAGVRTALHAFKLGVGAGRDNGSLAIALGATPYVGILALGIQGGDVDYPKGARAIAKTNVDSVLPPLTQISPSVSNTQPGTPRQSLEAALDLEGIPLGG